MAETRLHKLMESSSIMGYELTSAFLPAGGKDGTLKESDHCILTRFFCIFLNIATTDSMVN